MTAGERILAIATREIGYHEDRYKHNKYGEWYGLDGQPWCMIFVQWCYAQAWLSLPYKTASCGVLLNWYKMHARACVTDKPVPGCIVIFDFPGGAATDHTGLFVNRTDTEITTIDGNTSGTNQANGGWVQQKTRRLSYAKPTFIVPEALTRENHMAEAGKKEETMERRYNTVDEIREAAPWAAATVENLMRKGVLQGGGTGLDLSRDMLRLLVLCERAGAFVG